MNAKHGINERGIWDTTYQFNAPPDHQSPLDGVLRELRRWDELPQGANHRQAAVSFASRSVVEQNLENEHNAFQVSPGAKSLVKLQPSSHLFEPVHGVE